LNNKNKTILDLTQSKKNFISFFSAAYASFVVPVFDSGPV
jgi:hypothetical protein